MTSMTGTNFYMKNKWEVDLRIRKMLEGSFFYPLIDMIPYVQKTTFQSFIQSCYDKDSRTFTFGRDRKVELYFGLEDVFALSGFPVDGRQIVCDDIDAKKLCEDMLGTYEEECAMTMKVSQKWLKKKFEVVPENISEHDIAHYVRGYLIYLIGSKVLPNCDKTTYYPIYWLQFLEGLSPSKLNDVAWGAAAHAMLHTCLGSRTRKNVKGPMWILELFFMERFPKIANLYMGVKKTIGSSELKVKAVPLFDYWCPLMVHPGKVTGKPQPEEFVFIRDQMTSKDVNWIPYLDYPRYFRQKIFFSRVVLFCFDQIIYHEPEKGIHQLEIVNLQPVERLEALVVKSSKGCQQRKLMDSYRPYIQMWENRHLDSNCIRDARPTFSLPSAPAKNDSVGPQTDQHVNHQDGDAGLPEGSKMNASIGDESRKENPEVNLDKSKSSWIALIVQHEKPKIVKGKRGKRRTISSINIEASPQDCQDSLKQKANGGLEGNLEPCVEKSLDSMSDGQPLSRWFEGMHSTTTVDSTVASKKQLENLEVSPAVDGGKLSFVKSSPLWETLESMEVFRKIPQKPHFRPLNVLKESAREGQAISQMVNFSKVVENTSALRFENSRNAIEECLEVLVELESHGFDVKLIRDRLTRLLLIKDKQEELESRRKEVENKIEIESVEGRRDDEEIEVLDKKIRELYERRSQVLLKKEKTGLELGGLEAEFDGIKVGLNEIRHEFDGLAAASLCPP